MGGGAERGEGGDRERREGGKGRGKKKGGGELRGNPENAHALIWRAALGRGSRRRDKLWSSGKRSGSGSPRGALSSDCSLAPALLGAVGAEGGMGEGRGERSSSASLKLNVTPRISDPPLWGPELTSGRRPDFPGEPSASPA